MGSHGAFGYFYANPANDCFFTLRAVSDQTARFDFGAAPATPGLAAARFRKAVRNITMAQAFLPGNRLDLNLERIDHARDQRDSASGPR